ncbi:MAG: acylphosphatase [Acidimicrobiia bacterium]|nr:acylphosphatase [Acidimicrobiia bacterium]MYB79802.1 acylphosphatase [Acidimicrobiia bacterium]MYG92338.1 acylphosphatase [Acidimicrobiia bacterium]
MPGSRRRPRGERTPGRHVTEPSDRAYLRAVVRGRVQGVGFRWWVHELARTLELVGRVSNQPNGAVLVMAEGSRADLEKLVEGLSVGPRHAAVTGVEAEWSTPRHRWRRFAIDHG